MSKELEVLANELLKEHEASQALRGKLQKSAREAATSAEVMICIVCTRPQVITFGGLHV